MNRYFTPNLNNAAYLGQFFTKDQIEKKWEIDKYKGIGRWFYYFPITEEKARDMLGSMDQESKNYIKKREELKKWMPEKPL